MSGTVEIKPEVPTIHLQPKAVARIADAGFRIDPAAGHVTFTNDGARRPPVEARLPDNPSAGPGLPVLARVVVVTLPQATIRLRLLVLLSSEGTCLATTPQAEARGFDAMWPAGRLEQLTAYGVQVDREDCPDRKRLQRRYPGSARWWWLLTFPYAIVPFGLFWALVVLLIALLV